VLLQLGVVINRPVEQVFAFVRDIDQQGQSDRVVTMEKVTSGPAGVGTQYREQVKMPFGGPGELIVEITELEEPHKLSTRFQGPVMHGEIDYTFRPHGEGTELQQVERITYTGWAWPANLVGRPALRAKVPKRLDGFRRRLEAPV
jgi:hypothetical protein